MAIIIDQDHWPPMEIVYRNRLWDVFIDCHGRDEIDLVSRPSIVIAIINRLGEASIDSDYHHKKIW